jgi:predicted oxidoreductase
MLEATVSAGGNLINRDRMWHYTEGVKNYAPIWSRHGIRIIPGPSSLWFDATGKRLPAPLFPGFDTLGTLKHLRATGHDHSWFILIQRIIGTEFALSGSDQNPDLTTRRIGQVLNRVRDKSTSPVAAFQKQGEDFVTAGDLGELVKKMNALTGGKPAMTRPRFATRSRRGIARSSTNSARMPRSRPSAPPAPSSATS